MSELESKKRALENESEIALALSRKRTSLGDPTTPSDPAEEIILKALVPNTMAGVLIGKEGSTIKFMTETSGAKIRVSASKVFYPGTNERLVLILGTKDAIVNAVEQIAAKLAEFISADKKEEPSAEKPADEGN
jgi:RNA-binding protein Nova